MFPLFVPQVLEHETSDGCDKSKAAAVKLNGTLGPSTVTGHGPGMPIDVDGPADAAATALAAALDAALAATATQQSGNSGADSKRKHRELGPAVELPGVPPAASLGAAPTAPPNAPPRKKNEANAAVTRTTTTTSRLSCLSAKRRPGPRSGAGERSYSDPAGTGEGGGWVLPPLAAAHKTK